jgi:hypothetical protein
MPSFERASFTSSSLKRFDDGLDQFHAASRNESSAFAIRHAENTKIRPKSAKKTVGPDGECSEQRQKINLMLKLWTQ